MTISVKSSQDILALKGSDLGVSEWIEVTQERINQFADATGDHQWIHVDPERAKAGPFGRTIAHGYLTLALVVPLFMQLMRFEGGSMSINYGLNKVRFITPVPVGSRIRLIGKLADVTEIPGGVELLVDLVVELDGGGRPACVAQTVYRHLD